VLLWTSALLWSLAVSQVTGKSRCDGFQIEYSSYAEGYVRKLVYSKQIPTTDKVRENVPLEPGGRGTQYQLGYSLLKWVQMRRSSLLHRFSHFANKFTFTAVRLQAQPDGLLLGPLQYSACTTGTHGRKCWLGRGGPLQYSACTTGPHGRKCWLETVNLLCSQASGLVFSCVAWKWASQQTPEHTLELYRQELADAPIRYCRAISWNPL